MIGINEIISLYDDEIGVVCAPEYGEVRVTSPSHAQLIEKYIIEYQNHGLNSNEETIFADYILRFFSGSKKLEGIKFPGLTDRTSLNRVEIVVTNSCNLNCKYCYANGGSYGLNNNHLSPEEAVKCIDALINSGYKKIKEIMFFGGEPTLFPATIEAACRFIKEKYEAGKLESLPSFTMVTNGTLIDDYIAEIVSKYHIYVTISIDGPIDINDSLRVDYQGNGTFDKVSAGISLLKKWGVRIRLIEATYTSLHKKLGYSREWIKEYLSSLFDVEDVMVAECEDVASSHGYACKDMQEVIEFSTLNSDKSTEARLIKGMSSRPRYFECSCEGGYGNLSIIPGGDIYPCHLYIGHKEYQMASLKEDRYIFNDIYDVLEKGSKNNELCKKCWARVFCSMCPAVIGLSEPALEFMCSVEKEAIRKMILKYTKSMFLEKQRKEEMVHA